MSLLAGRGLELLLLMLLFSHVPIVLVLPKMIREIGGPVWWRLLWACGMRWSYVREGMK